MERSKTGWTEKKWWKVEVQKKLTVNMMQPWQILYRVTSFEDRVGDFCFATTKEAVPPSPPLPPHECIMRQAGPLSEQQCPADFRPARCYHANVERLSLFSFPSKPPLVCFFLYFFSPFFSLFSFRGQLSLPTIPSQNQLPWPSIIHCII